MRSANCIRELRHAVETKKRIVFVRETDPQHGGVAMDTHRRDCPEELRHALNHHPIVPWYRVKAYSAVTLRLILRCVLNAEVRIPTEVRRPGLVPAPAGSYDLYVSQRNEGAMEVAGLLVAEAQRAGVELTITSTPSEAHLARRFLLYLNDVTHDDSPALHAELEAALREKRPLLPVHEQRDAHGAVPFGEIMNRTPRDLLKLNIYRCSDAAIPFYKGLFGFEHTLTCVWVCARVFAQRDCHPSLRRRAPAGKPVRLDGPRR